jgi:hypothetical protein
MTQNDRERVNDNNAVLSPIYPPDEQDALRQEIATRGFVHIPAQRMRRGITEHASLARYWDNLPLDRYMRDGGTYRRRRFGRFRLDLDAALLAWDSEQGFVQSPDINRFAGGIERCFDPLEAGFIEHPLFRALVHGYATLLPAKEPRRRWSIEVHAIRIVARRSETGNPNPEGIHSDGRDFVAQVFIARSPDVVGGQSGVYNQAGQCLFSRTLSQALEAIVVDDRRVLHGASLVSPGGRADTVTRDMLFVNYSTVN